MQNAYKKDLGSISRRYDLYKYVDIMQLHHASSSSWMLLHLLYHVGLSFLSSEGPNVPQRLLTGKVQLQGCIPAISPATPRVCV